MGFKMRCILRPLTGIIIFFVSYCGILMAKEQPDILLKRLTQEMITALRQHDKELDKQPTLIFKIVDRIIVPYIDWTAMASWVVGRNEWLHASDSQRMRFTQELRELLIRTYASTLKAYNDQVIEYLPIRGGIDHKPKVQINSLIKEPGKEPIHVTYRLVNKEEGWKVYDISIEGVSLLQGFQSQFESEIRQFGLEALIERLHKHNEKPLKG
jgi:phospholipid transport system substrate-binding protein